MQRIINHAKTFGGYLVWLLDQLLGTVPNLVRANRSLSKKLVEKQLEDLSEDDRLQFPEDVIQAEFQFDLDRLERIEDKARSTVIGVALSISFAAPGILLLVNSEVFADEGLPLRISAACLLFLAIAYLLTSGYLALTGYRTGGVYQPRLHDRAEWTSKADARLFILRCIDLNILLVIQRSNVISASIDCLRNGIVAMLIFLLVAMLSTF